MVKITDIILLVLALIYLGFSIWYSITMDKILDDIKKVTRNDTKKETKNDKNVDFK